MEKKKVLSEMISDEIFNMITIEKRFKPGDKLPSEQVLSCELNVSRTTLREATKQLAERGILEIRRGSGTFVSENNLDWDVLKIGEIAHKPMEAIDLVEIRLILEPEMAYLAATRATESEIKRICAYGKQLEEIILSGKDKRELEQKFHMSIAQSVHNSFVDKLMPVLFLAIGKTSSVFWKNEKLDIDAIDDHNMLMEYIRNRDGDAARAVMKFHILRGVRDYKKRNK
ncbi:MAG: FadR/GntR family transcriptional regulator [Anaerotignaceae bacterium]